MCRKPEISDAIFFNSARFAQFIGGQIHYQTGIGEFEFKRPRWLAQRTA
ncbi:hypothetical protein [Paraburkholderia sp.]|nr:hypothetical protein [Paraburkholderia sp.]